MRANGAHRELIHPWPEDRAVGRQKICPGKRDLSLNDQRSASSDKTRYHVAAFGQPSLIIVHGENQRGGAVKPLRRQRILIDDLDKVGEFRRRRRPVRLSRMAVNKQRFLAYRRHTAPLRRI